MKLSEYFPVWDQLTEAQQNMLEHSAVYREIPKGTLLHNGELDCLGMILVESGRLRAYIVSEEGKENYHLQAAEQGYLPVFRLLHDEKYPV